MIDVSWRIEEEDREYELTGAPRALLGTWHYLLGALRRGWRIWALMALLGAELGLASVALLPPTSTATSLVLMAHPSTIAAQSGMATDVGLLTTREVAVRTLRALQVTMTPEDFQSTIHAEPLTAELLAISVSAPDDRSAVARTDVLTEQYLTFRAEQLRSLSKGLVDGYRYRISALETQVTELTAAYARESAKGASGQDRASDLLARRSQLNGQIVEMQAAAEDAELAADAAVASTHVVDRATIERRSVTRQLVLNLASGLIVGTALGMGFVLFRALTSDKVLRRQDVAAALGAPVRVSVVSTGPGRRGGRFGGSGRRAWRGDDLPALVHGLVSRVLLGWGATPAGAKAARRRPPGVSAAVTEGPQGLALAALDNAHAGADVVAGVASALTGSGRAVLLVDLSQSGALVNRLARSRGGGDLAPTDGGPPDEVLGRAGLTVFRPAGSVSLARGLRDALGGGPEDVRARDTELREMWVAADVVLVLAEVDPGIDAENLASWVGQVVPLVTAGQSSAELLRTTAELVRAAGLGLPFAMMVGADPTDESLGMTRPDAVGATPTGSSR